MRSLFHRPWIRLAIVEAIVVAAGLGVLLALASALDARTLAIGVWLRTG